MSKVVAITLHNRRVKDEPMKTAKILNLRRDEKFLAMNLSVLDIGVQQNYTEFTYSTSKNQARPGEGTEVVRYQYNRFLPIRYQI